MTARRHGDARQAKAKRSLAIGRFELSQATTPRVSAASPMSMAVKADDPVLRAMINEALERKQNGT